MCFSIELAAIDAARNCRRRYRVKASQDLFGAWLVTIKFGRLGTPGRTITHVADDERQARRLVTACLRVRATHGGSGSLTRARPLGIVVMVGYCVRRTALARDR